MNRLRKAGFPPAIPHTPCSPLNRVQEGQFRGSYLLGF